MRFKIVLLVRNEAFGNVLPVSYQFELSSCIYRKIMDNRTDYLNWLSKNGFSEDTNLKHKLFSISNLYIPKIKVEEDRLHILTKRIQLWVSFLPERGTEEFIMRIFSNQMMLIGDKYSQVEFMVEGIEKCPEQEWSGYVDYLALSPIVISLPRINKSVEYMNPEDPNYSKTLLHNLLDKYSHFYGRPYQGETECEFELLSQPKRKGIFIKRFTKDETKVIGYMYKFRIKLPIVLHKLLYNTGLGDKVGLGFGCVERIKIPVED
ncbi:MAG: CRISPR-associated endoribonuclease Cas6 [Bacteroidales bacterium]|nr:CRISPR-associated endoribonuclease Cas6 [Bacteroidales bacterium]